MTQSAPLAIITGAGRGIGRATALELAGLGYRLCLAARDPAGLDETAALASGRPDTCLAIPTDVTDPEQVDRLVRQALDRFGRIDALINNAGLAPIRPIAATSASCRSAIADTMVLSPTSKQAQTIGPRSATALGARPANTEATEGASPSIANR